MFKKIATLCSLFLLSTAIVAHANTITFDATGSGGDGALAASAAFVTSSGQIQITLTNLLSAASIVSVGEAIADVSFTVSNAPGTQGTATAVGQEGDVNSGKVNYSVGSGEPTSPGRFIGVGGGAYTISGDSITLEAIGGGQPDELILPYLANGATYASLNNGASSHNPYTIGPAVITLDLSGITSMTQISDVDISFGTSPDTFLTATKVVTPEPSSLLLLGTGIMGAAGLFYRKMSHGEAERK